MSAVPYNQAHTGLLVYILVFSPFFFRKALESLAGRESGDHHHLREQAQRDMAALREAFNQRIADLEHVSHNNESAMFNFA